jgi:hypothetical protein
MIANPQHALDLGDFPLIGGEGESGWKVNVHASDASFGESQPVLVGVRSLLRDGMSVRVQSHENRDAYFLVEISGPDLAAVGDGEAALMAQLYRRNTLTWTPPDGYGAVTVFEVVTSKMSAPLDDTNELMLKRVFGITLTCLPFSRSVDMVTAGADSVSDTVTVSDDCESTTGWSPMTGKSGNGYTPTFAVDSTAGFFVTGTGSVKVTPAPGLPTVSSGSKFTNTAFAKVLSIDASAGGYLTFAMRVGADVRESQFRDCFVTTSGGGRAAVVPLNAGAIGSGFVRYAIPVPHLSTITLLELELNIAVDFEAMPNLWFDSIGLAGSATNPQKMRSFEVLGSARTEGTFAISSPAGVAGLGDVLLYTTPDLGDGFRPDLKRWLVSGSTTVDAAAVTGTYVGLQATGAGARTFEAPATSFRPGAYAVLARLKASGSTTIKPVVKAQMLQGADLVGGVESTAEQFITLSGLTDYDLVRVGVLHLPPTLPDPLNAAAKIRFSVTDEFSTARLDELLVLPMEEAALTWVRCGSGTPSPAVSSRLWIDGPTLDYPRGRVQVGTSAVRADARTVRPLARGSHMLYPGTMFCYLLTTGSATAGMSTDYYPAWHTHAGS